MLGYIQSIFHNNKQETAVKRAIDECIKEGILVDFLSANRSEVELTSLFEYNKEEEEKKLRKAEYDLGHDDGMRQGIENFVAACIELEIKNEIIKEKLMDKFSLTGAEAETCVEKYRT